MESYNVISVAFVAMLLIMVSGMAISYSDPYEYWSDVAIEEGEPSYHVGSSGSAEFSLVSIKEGVMHAPSKVYVYYDDRYGISEDYCSTETYDDMLIELAIRNVDAEGVDADSLKTLMECENASGFAVVFITGAIPDTVYSGSTDDLFFRWFDKGGSVYWVGPSIGKYVANSDGTTTEINSWQGLFFGEGTINDGGFKEFAKKRVSDICLSLCLRSSAVPYGLSAQIPDSLELSFVNESDYSASSVVKFRNGQIGVVGAPFSDASRTDLSQMIASGLTYDCEIIDTTIVSTHHGSVTGSLPVVGDAVYVFCGGYYSPYGERFDLS